MQTPRPASTVLSAALAATLAAMVAACGEAPSATAVLTPAEREAQAAGYLAPPTVDRVRRGASNLSLEGAGPPEGRLQLVESGGRAYSTTIDPSGRWRISAPTADEARLFTVAAEQDDRPLEAEGRLLLLPDGRALMLRPGHGALPVGPNPGGPPRIVSIDVASDGAAAVSGFAPPSARAVSVVDGAPPAEELIVGQGAADRNGRFAIILASPLTPGPHSVVVNTPQGVALARLSVAVPTDLGERAFEASREGGDWRVSWRLPRGGVQTTYLPTPGA